MRLHVVVSPSHAVLLQDWFLPSLRAHHGERFEIRIHSAPQRCPSGEFRTPGWSAAVLEKTLFVVAAVREHWGGEFLFSDVDVQFLGDALGELTSLPRQTDLFFQKDSPTGILCSGFFVCRANERTLAFWEDVVLQLRLAKAKGDQAAVNAILRPTRRWWPRRLSQRHVELPSFGYLPERFFGGGTFTGRHWHPGDDLPVPEAPLVHHANWTEGIANKLAQLALVREKVRGRDRTAVRSSG